MLKKQLKKLHLINFILLAFAGIINSIGVTMFLAPVNLYDSGISGNSILLSQLTNYELSLFLILINIPLFLFGLKKQGITFTIYSVFAVGIYSLSAFLINSVLPIDLSIASPLAGTDLLLCAIFGGIISGVGSGLTIRSGGALDGMEVMAVIFAKKIGITVGTFVMLYNVALYILCGILLKSWILPLYSVVAYGAGLKTIDFIVEGIDRSKSAIIITDKVDDICSALSEYLGCGITVLDAQGYYSKENKKMIYVVLNRFQITKMREIVHLEDANAYITITDIADVFKNKKT